MSARSQLILASLLFTVCWTGGMLWWSAPLDTAKIVIWLICGCAVGLLWYWLFDSWYKQQG